MKCCNGHHTTISPKKTHLTNTEHRFLNYESNVKSILLGYMNGSGAGNLDAMAVLLDLPNGRNFTRSFSRHQEFVGETIRSVSAKEMDLALAMELKATVIHEESEEYYEYWIKEDELTRKNSDLQCLTIWDGNGVRVVTIMYLCPGTDS